jgi:uncharacterized protein with HEPN domain
VNETAATALLMMRANALIAIEYASAHPGWRGQRLVVDAIAKRVEEVAEAAKMRFPRALRGDYGDIEWDRIVGMRDRLVHDYGSVDLDVLCDVVERHLPALVASIDRILPPSG